MKRDGACISLWQHKMPDYKTQKPQNTTRVYDALIVGGGITGLSTALQLQKAGRECMLAEAQTIGFGTTGGTTAHLNTFMDSPYNEIQKNFGEKSAQLVAKAAKQALELIKRNVDEYKIDCDFEIQEGYLYSQDEKQSRELKDILKASDEAGVEVTIADNIPVPILFDNAIVFANQAQIHPAHYIYGLAKEFENAGGVLVQDCRITGVEENEVLDVTTTLSWFTF